VTATAAPAGPSPVQRLIDESAELFTVRVPDLRDSAAFFLNLGRTGGGVVPFRGAGGTANFLLSRPEHAEHVLVTRAANYESPAHPFASLDGQYAPEGAFMLKLDTRPGAGDAAQEQIARDYVAVTLDSARALAETSESGPADVAHEVKRLLFRATTRILFGTDVPRWADAFVRAAGFLEVLQVNLGLGPPPRGHPLEGAYLAAQEVRDRTMADVLRQWGPPPPGMTVGQRRSAAIATVMNAYGGSSAALAWVLYLLAIHPAERRQVEDEVDRVLAEPPRLARTFRELTYTRLVIMEALRLYPPAWILGGRAKAEDSIGGVYIPAGAEIMASPLTIHRNPDLWDRPNEFDPERFAPHRSGGRHRLAYLPFGAGEHRCPAGHLVVGQLQVVLGTLLRHLRIGALHGGPVRPRGLVALRPNPGVYMTFHRRDDVEPWPEGTPLAARVAEV
jgi:cytochrome P450